MNQYNNGAGNRGRNRGNWRGWRGRKPTTHFRGNRTPNYGREGGGYDSDSEQSSPNVITDHFSQVPCPYKGWKLYFPDEGYHDDHPLLRTIRIFERYFARAPGYSFTRENLTSASSFTVDLRGLFADEEIRRDIPNIECEVINSPEKLFSCLGQAMHQLVSLELEEVKSARIRARLGRSGWSSDEEDFDKENDDRSSLDDENCALPMMRARLINMEPEVPLKNLKQSYFEKFVAIRGTVIRVGNIRPHCTKLAFKCESCGRVQSYVLPDGKYAAPSKCVSRECRGRLFTPDRASPLTELVDLQTIRLQEMSDSAEETGRVPRTIECELMQESIESCVPGDEVTVAGIVKMASNSDGATAMKQDKQLFLIYIQAHSVLNRKRPAPDADSDRQSPKSGVTNDAESVTDKSFHSSTNGAFTRSELERLVQEVRSQRHLFRLLVASLCPSIFGHETVKAGLLLGLFGGTRRHEQMPNRVPERGDPHVLVVGDPGLGKSQMLRACADVSPRGVYVCGNTTTTSGLTVTLTKDGSSGDSGLEAGALVLSDQGCCCIDEFDKMGSQHQALLEAMEQQSISIAKAGIVCSMPARASVLAAANPVGGHYNKAKTVSENLKMGSALLSRFDLVFILVDKPDEKIDRMLSKHVMALHSEAGMSRTSVMDRWTQATSQNAANLSIVSDVVNTPSLRERLKPEKDEIIDTIPQPILKAYIGYARSKIHPRLSPPAAKMLQKFYVQLRRQHQGPDCTPVTTRQLQSLIRLSEARARCELREVVTEEDAIDVIEIMNYSMVDTYSDQFGVLDFQRSQHGSGMSSRSVSKKFIAILTRQSERTGNSTFNTQKLREIAKENNLKVNNFEDFIDSLNNHGYLLKKGPQLFKLNTV